MTFARALGLVGALACQGAEDRCDVVQIGLDAAAVGATDCGVQADGASDVDTCMAQHLRDGSPFVGVTQEPGALDLITRSWVYDGAALTIYLGRFTSCTVDGCVGEVEQLDCPLASASFEGEVGSITCTWGDEAPCGPIVCGGDGDGC